MQTKMGLGPSRLTYDMPPPPPLTPTEADLDLSINASHLHDRIPDPEGYQMCRGVAIREGIYASGVAMALMGLTVMAVKRKATTFPTVQALLGYSPGVLFLVSSAGLATAAWFTEVTLHDCNTQRGIFMQNYYESVGLNAIETTETISDPNRERKVNWNVKRKYVHQDPPAASSTDAAPGKA